MTRAEQAARWIASRCRGQAHPAPGGPFERQHDRSGVINAFRLVKKHHDVRLVLAGPPSAPEETPRRRARGGRSDPDIAVIVLPGPQTELNALERAATIAIQKPLKATSPSRWPPRCGRESR